MDFAGGAILLVEASLRDLKGSLPGHMCGLRFFGDWCDVDLPGGGVKVIVPLK